jgi:hypothetical protein
MSFTILDWQIIEKITDKKEDFTLDCISEERILQLCFNIFPGINTAIHSFMKSRVHVRTL